MGRATAEIRVCHCARVYKYKFEFDHQSKQLHPPWRNWLARSTVIHSTSRGWWFEPTRRRYFAVFSFLFFVLRFLAWVVVPYIHAWSVFHSWLLLGTHILGIIQINFGILLTPISSTNFCNFPLQPHTRLFRVSLGVWGMRVGVPWDRNVISLPRWDILQVKLTF